MERSPRYDSTKPIQASTFTQRAKEWSTTPFVAEWMHNTFVQCTSPEGKQKFETWVVKKWGPKKGQEMINECNIRLPRGVVSTHKGKMDTLEKFAVAWRSSAAFYGVTFKAMQYWHQYAGHGGLFEPERTKPAPKRRRGETAGQWMSRVHEMLLDGHKLPSIDLEAARRIAISEYDKTRDTLELWRSDAKFFFSDIIRRSQSVIPSPNTLLKDARTRQWIAVDDAFRTRTIFLIMVHLAWKDAAELFEYLAEHGLNTPSAIERAYQKDHALLWRFTSVMLRTSSMSRKMWANFSQLVAASDHFKPLLRAWRDDTGLARIEANEPEIRARSRQGRYHRLDEVVVIAMVEIAPGVNSFFQAMDAALSDNPEQAQKFSPAVFEAMGDLASAHEFLNLLNNTPFGNRLTEYAAGVEARLTDRRQMSSIMYFMDPKKLRPVEAKYWDEIGEVSRSIRSMEEAWQAKTWEMSLETFLTYIQDQQGAKGFDETVTIPVPLFNHMWSHVDAYLWKVAKSFDRPGEEGRVAKEFGLFDPSDPKRPMASEFLLRSLDPELGTPLKPQTTPARAPYVQNIPVAGPADSIVQSGHAFVAVAASVAKEKPKTRGEALVQEEEEEEDIEKDVPILPEALPTEFKIGKKVTKLFHRVLEPPEEEKENAPAKGQVRWGDFENAMKRIGFEVVQTAGSSVRFDPPASTARPITFHRPHPDSLLTPHAIKWVGARLKRTYGWTTETFARGGE
ncbi:hypothetical protein C8R46DRAFT_279785 [Mycena filopes]|nr:hypothetical protein C8R46DRAFT_279785 [Mycena filopes]